MTGTKAPDFSLPSIAGERVSLTGLLATGPVLLAFYKSTCPTCQLTFPFLQRLANGSGPDAPQLIAISQDDGQTAREFNRRYGITFTTLLDLREGGYAVSNAYRITNVPTLFLVERGGQISQSISGFDKAELEGFAQRFGVALFTAGDRVPVFQPG